ncbi:MAG: hypothetical protein O7B26_13755 [Planctomycetota bacterium]|nr:hypothetical protein [Planctomycetota bacterium]
MNCEVSQSGLKSCEVRQCKKTTFTQKCEGGHCVFDGEPKVEDAGVPITIATGVSCSPVTDPDPGGGGVGG